MDLKHIRQIYLENATGVSAQLANLVEKTETQVIRLVKTGAKEAMFSIILSNEAEVDIYIPKIESLGFKIKKARGVVCPDGYYATFVISGWAEEDVKEDN